MARYKDVEGYRKLFDEEYKKKRKLISEGETHLDNLAEGFSEAGRVIDRMPTADVAPKSEVERLQEEIETLKDNNEHLAALLTEAKQEVAKEIFEKIEKIRLKEIHKCETLREQENEVLQLKYWEGGYNSLRQLSYWIAELKKKYTAEITIVRDLAEEAVDRDITNKQNEE